MFNMSWDELKNKAPKNVLPKKKNYEDNRFWKLQRDENDNGSALIRLLPDPDGIPLIKMFEHSIKVFNKATNKYRYFIQPSPATIGLPCPATEEWEKLNRSPLEEDKKLAKMYYRRTQYITNIYVVNDPANPQNNGKVFLWKFGVKLLNKFQNALEPSETDKAMGVKPVELFDPMRGANIMLKAKKVAGFINYDDTVIQQPSAIAQTEEEAKKIWEQTHSLKEFLEPGYYLSYEELKQKLDWTFGRETTKSSTTSTNLADMADNVSKSVTQPQPAKTENETPLRISEEDINEDLDDFLKELE
jgi:hypothetical protein